MNKSTLPFTRNALAATLLAASASYVVPTMANTLQLEEIIVTAQKRSENVQEISATVNVVTGSAMDEYAVANFGEAELLTAGLTLSTPNARNSSIAMRGINTDPEAGTASVVDVYWNDALIRADVAFTQLYDLERIEILRGPQGTLQGRTSPGGAIKIVTKQPTMSDSEGYVELTASDNDGFNSQAAYSSALIENVLAVRIAAVYDINNNGGAENLVTGLDNPEAKTKSARMSVGWTPTDTFSANFAYQWLDRPIDDPRPVTGVDKLGQRPTLQPDDRSSLEATDNDGKLEYDIATLEMNWDVIGHTLTSVTGYTDSHKFNHNENDRATYITNPEQLTYQTSDTAVDAITEELRFASTDNDFWDYMVGGYYSDQKTRTEFIANTTLTAGLPGVSFATNGAIPVDRTEYAIFTFNTFYLNEKTQLEAGLRWNRFERSTRADVYYAGANYAPAPFTLALVDQLIGKSGNFPINAISDENEDGNDTAPTGSLTLRYDWTESTALYASYNRGFRQGGISIVPDPDVNFLPDAENTLIYDEETSDALELGFKSTLLDGAATLNGALYYQQFDGYFGFVRGVQVVNESGQPVDISGGLVHNGDAEIWGVELEGQVLLSEAWSVGGAGSYSHGEWTDAQAPCNVREQGEALGYCDLDGEALGGEPEWSVSLNTEYLVPVMDSMEWYIRGLYKYTGERDNTDASAGIGAVTDEFDANTVVNVYSGVRSADLTWDVTVWAKNVFDENAVTYQTGSDQYDIALSGGSYTQANVVTERTIGITGRYNF